MKRKQPVDRKQVAKAIAVSAADDTVPIKQQLGHLHEAAERYFAHIDCPFKQGDLVTPRADSIYPHAGLPHVVLEVLDEIEPLWADIHCNTTRDGALLNMRIGVWRNGSMAAFWGESWQFEWFRNETEVGPA